MMRKWMALALILGLLFSLAACGGQEETTLTAMVVSVEGTVVSLMEMDAQGGANAGRPSGSDGQMPQRPEGMEDFAMPEGGFGGFGGMPGGMEDFTMPEGGFGGMPEGMEDFTMPEDFDPENFMSGGFGAMMPGGAMGGERPEMDMGENGGQTRTLDLANAHISVQIDGGKATGSMSDITVGVFVTVTLNDKGEATRVVVLGNSGFGGRG